jgi:hypothetical protein
MTTTPTKPVSVTAVIRQLVIKHRDATAKDLQAKLEAAGFPGVKMSTITTMRADTHATLREAAALGLLRSDSEQPEPAEPAQPAARPPRSRSRRRVAPVTDASA